MPTRARNAEKARPEPERPMTFAARRRAEQKYYRALRQVNAEISRQIEGLTDPDDIVRALKRIANSPRFDALCRRTAGQMASTMAVGAQKTWREAAAVSGQGQRIYRDLQRELIDTGRDRVLRDMAEQNAKLIKNMASETAQRMSSAALEMRMKGVRPAEIAKLLKTMGTEISDTRALLIARTESAKASTALVQARAEALGLDFYTWSTSNDGTRVRESHRHMHGVICRWSDPPTPEGRDAYPPGGIYNCRCVALPILFARNIQFPCKCWKDGRIHSIGTLKAFMELYGLNELKEGKYLAQ